MIGVRRTAWGAVIAGNARKRWPWPVSTDPVREVIWVNRFWRSLIAGGAAGAAIGAYFYFRSRRRRARALAGSMSDTERAARSASSMIKQATGQMVTRVGKGIVTAGAKTRAAGRRLRLGRTD